MHRTYSSLTNLLSSQVSTKPESTSPTRMLIQRPLPRINLSRCHALEDRHLIRIALASGAILKELYLDHCWNISNQALMLVLKNCPQLIKLSLANIYSIEDQLLRIVAECCPMLQWINLRECWRVTDFGIR